MTSYRTPRHPGAIVKLAAAILAIVGIYWLAVEIAFRMTGGAVDPEPEALFV